MIAIAEANSSTVAVPASAGDEAFLSSLGHRVRELRDRKGMTRKQMAKDAEVSERHLAHLEAGAGNVSIVLLRRIARALGVSLAELLLAEAEESVERRLIRRFLERVPGNRLEDVVLRLMSDFGHEEAVRRQRIALIGLRGAGKSTLGRRLARELGIPFVELVTEIEKDAGMPVSEIFSLYGQAGYRRIEKRTLERVLQQNERAILSIGGGVVAEAATFNHLLTQCFTVWLQARPEDLMARVVSQGDLRPMSGNAEAMADLRRILDARAPLYGKADVAIDTSIGGSEEIYDKLKKLVSV